LNFFSIIARTNQNVRAELIPILSKILLFPPCYRSGRSQKSRRNIQYHSMKRKIISLNFRILLLLGLAAVALAPKADVVTDWNQITLSTQSAIAGGIRTPSAGRALAMVHIAIFDSINAIDRQYQPYLIAPLANPHASKEAAVAAAAHTVLVGLYPTAQAALDAAYAASLSTVPHGSPKTEGISIGESVAAIILLLRSNDGSAANPPYTAAPRIGIYTPDPAALFVAWGAVTPFALKSGSQFRNDGPPPLSSDQYAADYNEVKSIGTLNSTTRTADQTQAALFWVENAQITWNNIARIAALASDNTLLENARLFALLNMAEADGSIASMDTKYTYNFWRPREAIHAGDLDGNPNTTADPAWVPLTYIGVHPDYNSQHAVIGAVSATILTHFFGRHHLTFSATTSSAPAGVLRSYNSFLEAAHENAHSRVWLGAHFQTACRDGFNQGKQVGHYVFSHYLRPLKHHKDDDIENCED
jgi:hypothetical protein